MTPLSTDHTAGKQGESPLETTPCLLLDYLATSPPNECPTIITDSTAGTSAYKPRIASTAWFRNSAWRTPWMAPDEINAGA